MLLEMTTIGRGKEEIRIDYYSRLSIASLLIVDVDMLIKTGTRNMLNRQRAN
jgi:hypothetical protein